MWWPLLIPIIVSYIIYRWKPEVLAWWEPLVLFTPTLVAIILMMLTAESYATRDKEWHTHQCVKIEHHEPYVREWEEWVSPQYDDKGRETVPGHYETRTEHTPEEWVKILENGASHSASRGDYNRIAGQWQAAGSKSVFTDLYHPDQRHRWGCPKGVHCNCSDGRGDMYHVLWPSSHNTIESVTSVHHWENRVIATKETVFRFPEIGPERAKELYTLPDPDDSGNAPSILGNGGPTTAEANKELSRWNALLGPRPGDDYQRACRMWLLIYHSPSDQEARDQEALWKGGKKNEVTLCLGLNTDNSVKWSYVISWTPNERLKINLRDYAMQKYKDTPVDLVDVVQRLATDCKNNYERKHSADWAYLSIEPPTWALVANWIVTLLINLGMAYFVVVNEAGAENRRWTRRVAYR